MTERRSTGHLSAVRKRIEEQQGTSNPEDFEILLIQMQCARPGQVERAVHDALKADNMHAPDCKGTEWFCTKQVEVATLVLQNSRSSGGAAAVTGSGTSSAKRRRTGAGSAARSAASSGGRRTEEEDMAAAIAASLEEGGGGRQGGVRPLRVLGRRIITSLPSPEWPEQNARHIVAQM